jgi:hypothetical protein
MKNKENNNNQMWFHYNTYTNQIFVKCVNYYV